MKFRADAVSRQFGGIHAIENVSFTLHDGEVLAIIGPNGSGKSTLVNCLTGLTRLSSGRVAIDDVAVTRWSSDRLARVGVARTFQDSRLFQTLSTFDNVLLGLHPCASVGSTSGWLPWKKAPRRHKAYTALEQVGMSAFASRLASELSHGQRRRTELARALVSAPGLLVLDEPSAGLTPDDTEVIAHLIKDFRSQGTAVLAIEHDMDLVEAVADRVLVLDTGHVVTNGTAATVLSDPLVRNLVGIAELASVNP